MRPSKSELLSIWSSNRNNIRFNLNLVSAVLCYDMVFWAGMGVGNPQRNATTQWSLLRRDAVAALSRMVVTR